MQVGAWASRYIRRSFAPLHRRPYKSLRAKCKAARRGLGIGVFMVAMGNTLGWIWLAGVPLLGLVASAGLAGCGLDCEKTATCARESSVSSGVGAGGAGSGGSGGAVGSGGGQAGGAGGMGGQSTCGNASVEPGELCLAESATPYGGFGYAEHLAVADCDSDGDMDVLVSSGFVNSGVVIALQNDGSGALDTSVESGSPNGSGRFAVGLLDASPGLDLAVGSNHSQNNIGKFAIWSGANDCTFTATPALNTTGLARGVALLQLNADGILDVLTIIDAGAQTVDKFGTKLSGSSVLSETPLAFEGANSLLTGDVNGDTVADVIYAQGGADTLWIRLVSGTTLGSPYAVTVPAGGETSGVALADMDGDGDNDLVVTNLLLHNVVVLLNDGSGAFTAQGPAIAVEGNGTLAARYPGLPAAADLDGDGDIDVVTINLSDKSDVFPDDAFNGNSSVSVLLNDGSGALSLAPGFPRAVQHLPASVVVGDINGDGAPDLVMSHATNPTSLVSVLFSEP